MNAERLSERLLENMDILHTTQWHEVCQNFLYPHIGAKPENQTYTKGTYNLHKNYRV